MATIEAVFMGGVFRPLQPVDLPESTKVSFEPKVLERTHLNGDMAKSTERERLAEVIRQMRELRDQNGPVLGDDLTIRELIEEGRR